VKNQHIHAGMADELAMTEVLAGFDDVDPTKTELISLLTKWTKYNRPDGFATMAKLGGDLQLCLIVNPMTQGVALVIRAFEDALVKVTIDDCLSRSSDGIIRAATADDEPLLGWVEYAALGKAERARIDASGRKPWNKYSITGMRVLARHAAGDDAATIANRVEMACTQGEQIIRLARTAYEFQIARDSEGWGGPAVGPTMDEIAGIDADFF
jgi:hypothetical protein